MNDDRRSRDEAAVREYGPAVYRLAFSQLRSRQDADDVYQEVFLRLVEKAPEFSGPEHEKAWLLRVTLNCCRDVFRSPWRKKFLPLEEADSQVPFDQDEQELHSAMRKLSKNERALLHLFYWEDMTAQQIAQVLNIRPDAVRKRLSRSREKLKKALEEEDKHNAGTNLQRYE